MILMNKKINTATFLFKYCRFAIFALIFSCLFLLAINLFQDLFTYSNLIAEAFTTIAFLIIFISIINSILLLPISIAMLLDRRVKILGLLYYISVVVFYIEIFMWVKQW